MLSKKYLIDFDIGFYALLDVEFFKKIEAKLDFANKKLLLDFLNCP